MNVLYPFRLHGLRWAGLMANNFSLSHDNINNTFSNTNNDDEGGGWFDWGETNLIVDENGFRMHSSNPVIVIGLMVGIFGSFYYGYWGMYQLSKLQPQISFLDTLYFTFFTYLSLFDS